MVIATKRKGGLGFITNRRRLNVALTRSMDALFVIADVKATMDQIPVAKTLKEGEAVNPESMGLNLEELQEGQGILRKITEYYVKQNCVYSVEISSLSDRYISFDEAEAFAANYNPKPRFCFSCQQPGHINANCTNPEVPSAPRPKRCKFCDSAEHRGIDCPQRLCKVCGETGHLRLDCPNKPTICFNCKMPGHLSKACPSPKRTRGSKACYTCGAKDHSSGQCPNF